LIDSSGTALLSDFGLSRIRHEVTRTHTVIREGGRPRFMAPELSAGKEESFRTSASSDIFSLAMTFLNVWTREAPFVELSSRRAGRLIEEGRRPNRPAEQLDLPTGMEQKFWLLLVDMWAHDPQNRPSSEDMQNRLETIFEPVLTP
jgi:serine/threonine protein kinase